MAFNLTSLVHTWFYYMWFFSKLGYFLSILFFITSCDSKSNGYEKFKLYSFKKKIPNLVVEMVIKVFLFNFLIVFKKLPTVNYKPYYYYYYCCFEIIYEGN